MLIELIRETAQWKLSLCGTLAVKLCFHRHKGTGVSMTGGHFLVGDVLGSGFYFSYSQKKGQDPPNSGGWTPFYSPHNHSPPQSHLVSYVWPPRACVLPVLTDTWPDGKAGSWSLAELRPGEERAQTDLIGIREDFSFLEFLVCGTPACCLWRHLSRSWCPGEQRELPVQNGTGEPRICGCSYLKGLRFLWEPLCP